MEAEACLQGKQTENQANKKSEFSLRGMNPPPMVQSHLFTERIFLVAWQLSGENGRDFILKMYSIQHLGYRVKAKAIDCPSGAQGGTSQLILPRELHFSDHGCGRVRREPGMERDLKLLFKPCPSDSHLCPLLSWASVSFQPCALKYLATLDFRRGLLRMSRRS